MKASIIICTYNEEKTIADVVMACCNLNPGNEIIVVDDGSTDNTEDILKELSKDYSYKYTRLDKNMGKSWAMVHGVELSKNEIILFFDADVTNIRKEHFDELVKPLIEKTADMVLGPPDTSVDWRIHPFKSLTGQRAMLKNDLLPILDEVREIRFGIETFFNLYYQAKGKRIKYVLMKGLKHKSTYAKSGSVSIATKKYIKEGIEIADTILDNFELINQRVELLVNKTNKNAKKKLNSIQNDIDTKLQDLKDNFKF